MEGCEMSKKKISFLLLLLSLISTSTGCFIYHKPEYKGQILDIDTKAPIQEAVVVAVYNKQTMGLGAGAFSSIINVQEALTDNKGNFRLPSYTTFINPFSWESYTLFIIFKPGYASMEMDLEDVFTGRISEFREGGWPWSKDLKFLLRMPNIVEIPTLKKREEFIARTLGFPIGYDEEDLPLLYQAFHNEEKMLERNP